MALAFTPLGPATVYVAIQWLDDEQAQPATAWQVFRRQVSP